MENQTFIGTSSGFIDLLIGARYDWADFGFGFSPASFAEANGPFDSATGNARALALWSNRRPGCRSTEIM